MFSATLSALDAPKTRQPNTEEVMKECKRLLSSFEQRTHDDVLDSRDHVQVSRAKEDIIHVSFSFCFFVWLYRFISYSICCV